MWLTLAALALTAAIAQDRFLENVLRPEDVTVRAKLLERHNPPYIGTALAGSEGRMRVEFIVEPDGSVRDVRITDGAREALVNDTIAALRTWKFEPARKDGIAVRSLAALTVTFAMRPQPSRAASGPRSALVASADLEGVDDDFGKGAVSMFAPGVVAPRALKPAKPTYPRGVRNAKDGIVEVEVVVGETGTVREARVIKSFDTRFDAGALETARQWIFSPGTKDGKPVPVLVVLQLAYFRN